MNRRGFLGMIGAAIASRFAPKATATPLLPPVTTARTGSTITVWYPRSYGFRGFTVSEELMKDMASSHAEVIATLPKKDPT